MCGHLGDKLLAGTPVDEHDYLVDVESDLNVQISDKFKDNKLSFMWQHPSNIDNFYEFNNKLIFKFNKTEYQDEINMIPYALLSKVPALEFDISTQIDFKDMQKGEHIGFTVMGLMYKAIDFKKEDNFIRVSLIEGSIGGKDKVLSQSYIEDSNVIINAQFRNKDIYTLLYTIHVNGVKVFNKEKAYAGKWVGAKIGYYGYKEEDTSGKAYVLYYNTNIIK